jgi:uncharacterized lipoprotein YajG
MPRLFALLLIALLPACALEADFVEVRAPQSSTAAAPIAGAERVRLAVEARDNRTIRDRVSNKINGYGMEMAPIHATNDVIAEARGAIVRDLEARGFTIPGGDGRLELEFMRIYSRFVVGFWSGSAQAEIAVNVRVLGPDGRLVFARPFTVEGVNAGIALASGENAKIALEAALGRMVQTINDDPEFQRALTSLAPAAPARRPRVGA